jgi:arylsulfatase A-like enzyme
VPHGVKEVHAVGNYGFDFWKQTQDLDKVRFVKAAGKSEWEELYGGLTKEQATQAAWITGQALEYLRSAAPGEPLYTFISYVQPHSPFCPPTAWLDRVDASKLPEPAKPTWVGDPLKRTKASWMEARRHYFADLAHLEDQLGELLDVLTKTGRLDNMYSIFTADHGEALSDHGMHSKAERHFDAVIRVPMTVVGRAWPRAPTAARPWPAGGRAATPKATTTSSAAA